MDERIAIYPGSFDPITIGHLDIIRRSAKLFDKIIVVVMSNHRKAGTHAFTVEERVELVRKCTENLPNVTVDSYMGLLAYNIIKLQSQTLEKCERRLSHKLQN